MSIIVQSDQLRALGFGAKVSRATATLPQTATGAIFNVTGGKVLVTSITGTVTTSLGATATNLRLVATPTVGAVNNLSANALVTSLAAGGLITIQGRVADVTVVSSGGGTSGQLNPVIVAAGAIGVTTDASNTGSVRWDLTYFALDNGASVAAA